jgi:TPP-dependent pyruvate/acetoin dehydrogenase alpha subunit
MGDGAFGEGVVYETLNIASQWQLPLLFVVENNGYSQSTPISVNLAGDIPARFAAFAIPVTRIDSTDVRGIHETATAEVNAARASRSPRALVIDTYRLCHHSKSDDNRPAEEIAERWRSEPLVVHGERLAESDRQRIDAEVEAALERVIETVRAMP